MKRILISMASAAVILAACGSDRSSGDTSPGGGSETVALRQVDTLGDVLVNSSGRTLYSADEEASGNILCTDACTAFWTPLAADGMPTAASGAPQLGVIDRPDGSKQVTADGKPLYTFTEDSPGEAKGNGFTDDFGSQHFTWHAVLASGTVSDTPGSSTTPGGY